MQLVFSHIGKRHYLSLGLPDNKVNRKAAEAKLKLIESDIACDRFDPTLAKYKPQLALSAFTSTPIPIGLLEPSLAQLWEQFVEYKRPQCSPNFMNTIYNVFTSYLQKLPTHDLSENIKPEELIFPGAKQGYLDFTSFRKNSWKQVLEGLEIEYRKLYQTRHTFITLALENELDAKDVARLVGNSPEVIYRHYAGNKRELLVPEI